MTTPTPQPKLVIRDGTYNDIDQCLKLDSSYDTEHVWQITIREDTIETHIALRKQRLPRILTAKHPSNKKRFEIIIQNRHCFVIVTEATTNVIIGYLAMRINPTYNIGYLQDIVIDRPYRDQGLGARLVSVARRWADEHELTHIIFEITTTNYPGIEFAKSQGFVFSGFNDQYLPDQEIALFFTLTL